MLGRLLLDHYDPWHNDDYLDALGREIPDRWAELGADGAVKLGHEGDVIDLAAAASAATRW